MGKDQSHYENLLKYLEKHESVAAKPKAPIVKKKEPSKEINKREEVKKLTKEMMKETETFSFVPSHVKKKYPTEGFNIRLFEEKLVKKLIEKHKKLQSYERPYMSVTEVIGCLRACYYHRKKYSIDLKKKYNYPYLYLKRKVGDAVHETIQDIYNFDEVEKTVISEKFHVKGRPDAISEDIFVIDFKPTENFREDVDLKHYDQGNIYATILNTEYGYSIQKVVIVYYLANFKNMQVFSNKIDINRGLEFLKRGKLLKDHLDKCILIDPIGAIEKECQYCPYIEYCEKDGYKEIAPPKLEKEFIKEPKKSIEKQTSQKAKKVKAKFQYKDPSDSFLL